MVCPRAFYLFAVYREIDRSVHIKIKKHISRALGCKSRMIGCGEVGEPYPRCKNGSTCCAEIKGSRVLRTHIGAATSVHVIPIVGTKSLALISTAEMECTLHKRIFNQPCSRLID